MALPGAALPMCGDELNPLGAVDRDNLAGVCSHRVLALSINK